MVIIYTDPFPSVLVPEKPQEMPDDEEEEDTTAAQKAAPRSSGLSAARSSGLSAARSSGLSADVKELCGVVRWLFLLQESFP